QDSHSSQRVRNIQEGKNVGCDLLDYPADYCLRDSDLINIAPLQLSEKSRRLHFEAVAPLNSLAGTIFSASTSKRGSPCSDASNGSMRIAVMLLPSCSR